MCLKVRRKGYMRGLEGGEGREKYCIYINFKYKNE